MEQVNKSTNSTTLNCSECKNITKLEKLPNLTSLTCCNCENITHLVDLNELTYKNKALVDY